MKVYMDKALLAANAAVTVSPPSNHFNENLMLMEFTTEKPASPKLNDDKSLAAEKNTVDEELGFSVVIVLLFFVGVVVNIACLVSLRRHRSTFHRFLKMLACFDALVVSCILLMYALPVMSPEYKTVVFLPMVPFFLPLVHMALMGSVYSTIVMSLERYLRLCKVQMMSKRAGTICCVFVVVFPMLFYSPKFLEYRYQKFVHNFPLPINCSQFVEEQRELAEFNQKLQWQDSISGSPIRHGNGHKMDAPLPKPEMYKLESLPAPSLYNYPMECMDFKFSLYNESDDYIRIIKQKRVVFFPNATEIRRNPYYYTIYCVGLNTCFATLLPLTALIYLNCMTLRALRILGRNTSSTPGNSVDGFRQLETIVEENSNQSREQHRSRLRTSLHTSSADHRGNRFICGFDNGSSSYGPGYEYNVRFNNHDRRVEIVHKDSFLQNYENLLRKKESRLTRISICIVWLFIICHVWKLIPTVYELLYSEDGLELPSWPDWLITIKHLSHTLIAFNSAVNFLIYAIL